MQRNSNAGQSFLIIAAVALLIVIPVLLSGFLELRSGYQARARNQHESAERHFRLAAQRLPWRQDLWEQAGIEALETQQPGRAIDWLSRAPGLSQPGAIALARAYMQVEDWEAARAAFETALQQGASAEIYAGLAEIYRHQNDLDAEPVALQNQLLFQPGDASAHYRLGLLFSLTDIDLSLAHLELASHLDPEFQPVFDTLRSALVLARLKTSESERSIMLGRALGLVNEWQLAALAFQQAVQADERNAQAWAWLGEARQHLGQDASADLDRALSLDSRSVIVRGLRGLYWRRQGDESLALREYEAAAAADPENPAWAVSLGESHARLGNLVSALADYERAVRLAPQDPVYWRLLAAFCAEYNLHIQEIGLPAAQKAVELSPEDSQSLEMLGWLQLVAGQPYSAQQTLLAVLDGRPDFALAHYHLALAYLQTGDRSQALHHLQVAVQLDPNGSTGAQAAQVIKQQFP